MLTKQHFETIAAVLKSTKPEAAEYDIFEAKRTAPQAAFLQWQQIVTAMANRFEQMNPRFQRGRFYTACGFYANLSEVR
jgi:hypothetical protein